MATGRAVKYGALKWDAERRIAKKNIDDSNIGAVNSAYLIGCGRSGTTVCGEVLRHHRDVRYFFEPYHLWATIDPTIDVLNLYRLGAASFILDAGRCTDEARRRFNRLLLDRAHSAGASLMLEKNAVQRLPDRISRCADSKLQIHSPRT